MVEQAIGALKRFFARASSPNPKPILWVGAGASAAAGYPTLWQLEEKIRAELPGIDKTGFELIDASPETSGKSSVSAPRATDLLEAVEIRDQIREKNSRVVAGHMGANGA